MVRFSHESMLCYSQGCRSGQNALYIDKIFLCVQNGGIACIVPVAEYKVKQGKTVRRTLKIERLSKSLGERNLRLTSLEGTRALSRLMLIRRKSTIL